MKKVLLSFRKYNKTTKTELFVHKLIVHKFRNLEMVSKHIVAGYRVIGIEYAINITQEKGEMCYNMYSKYNM